MQCNTNKGRKNETERGRERDGSILSLETIECVKINFLIPIYSARMITSKVFYKIIHKGFIHSYLRCVSAILQIIWITKKYTLQIVREKLSTPKKKIKKKKLLSFLLSRIISSLMYWFDRRSASTAHCSAKTAESRIHDGNEATYNGAKEQKRKKIMIPWRVTGNGK